MTLTVFSWIATGLSLLGNRFVNRKNVTGMWIWTFSNCIWIVLAFVRKDYAQMFLWMAYMYFSIEGIIKWSQCERSKN
jgi:hypothetical protein